MTQTAQRDPRWPAFAARHGLDLERLAQGEVETLEPVELQRALIGRSTPYTWRGTAHHSRDG
ncbi:hypothetical protein [Streptosporangium carneum]|uniref:Uncharacterized protein n=1 Tax=Streptosporangium carneum TaxID=47481 RepID=A0A9W6I067_9ACTN|nr:hypothetical protein [Streptosporangium carneum]GLK09288.1 hypothetical protein GCM10017600_26940 [Streptosporangium carneum]